MTNDDDVAREDVEREPMRRGFVLITGGKKPWIDALGIIDELLEDLSPIDRDRCLSACRVALFEAARATQDKAD